MNTRSEGTEPASPLTLRDWFAGQALVGLLAFSRGDCRQLTPEEAAEEAYDTAHAMLGERAKKDGSGEHAE